MGTTSAAANLKNHERILMILLFKKNDAFKSLPIRPRLERRIILLLLLSRNRRRRRRRRRRTPIERKKRRKMRALLLRRRQNRCY